MQEMCIDPGFDASAPAFNELKRLLASQARPLALVGAGTSIASGYPSWPGLIELFDNHLDPKTAPKWRQALRTLNDPLWQAEEYREVLGKEVFEALLTQTFAGRGVAEPQLALASLPFRHFLTTNFDPCLEKALGAVTSKAPQRWFCWHEAGKLSSFLRALSNAIEEPWIVYLHGRYHEPSNVVLTESSYVRRYIKDEDARRKLLAIFFTHPVVFVGFSMEDPDLGQLMREVATRLGEGGHHYAIMSYRTEDEREAIDRRMEGKFGIKVIFYRSKADDHSALTTLLRALGPETISVPAAAMELSDTLAASAEAVGVSTSPVDPTDPHKGQFGGTASNGSFTVSAEPLNDGEDWLEFRLVVTAQNGAQLEDGEEVVFHLHPTFRRDVIKVTAKKGRATLKLTGYGAFTTGVEIPARGVRLELDLSEIQALPDWFRER